MSIVKKGRALYWRAAEWSFVMGGLCLLLVYARTAPRDVHLRRRLVPSSGLTRDRAS